jgi:PncC family amidohydrolase
MHYWSNTMIEEYARKVVGQMTQRRQTLATAESCSGGRLAAALTGIAGASLVFHGGLVAYSNDVKQRLLGVSEATLGEHGAVSRATALQMAEGAQQLFGVDFAVATTGIAGPGGGTAAKPVGLVYIAWATPKEVEVAQLNLSGSRGAIQDESVRLALKRLLELVEAG